ncbi:MAG: ABC transporter permease [Verrucomicrobiales bacterium]|nr:ABC transporter permease [Verrucomicrobiales bacterium]
MAKRLDIGFDPRNVWVAGFQLPEVSTDRETARAWYENLRRRVAQLPGVRDVTLSHWLPMGFEGGDHSRFEVEGYTPPPGEGAQAGFIVVGPNFSRALGMRLTAGRDLTEGDDFQAPRVALVNDEFVRRYLSGREAVGREIKFWGGTVHIAGVVRSGPYRRLGEPPEPMVYVPHLQFPRNSINLVVRTVNAPESVRLEVDRVAASLSPAVLPLASMSMENYVGAAYAIPKVSAIMLTVLGGVALLLAVLGLYAVLAQGVAQRQKELGVRLALGAEPRGLALLVVRQGARFLAIGGLLGVVAALGVGQVLQGVLVGVRTWDPWAWSGVFVVLGVATLAASWIPAWRASRVDPMEALRNE